MLTVEQAQEIILNSIAVLPAQDTPLLEALGRTLAEAVTAPISLPPFDNSAMDGYAVIAADTEGATPENMRRLRLLEKDVPAGTAPTEVVRRGTAARIMTGAPAPAGADAVVMVEHTQLSPEGFVEIFVPVKAGDNLRPKGEDIQAGQPALAAGEILGPGELGLLASLGYANISAIRQPRVAIVTTGSELVEPGQALKAGAIYNSNKITLAGRVLRAGAALAAMLHVEDHEQAVEDALSKCATADLILTTGGVSVGEYDFVKNALERLGEIKFWRVMLKPGKPVAFGTVLGRPLFGLPGNPVSALVTFELLVAPALRKMMGRKECLPPTIEATLLSDVSHKPPRRELRQAFTSYDAARGYVVRPAEKRGSAMLTSMVGVNSLLVIPEESKGLRAGDKATVIFPAYQE
jgi:molybdopterin molybdotransferase